MSNLNQNGRQFQSIFEREPHSRAIKHAPDVTDFARELAIEVLRRVLASAPSKRLKVLAWRAMSHLVRGRSAGAIAAMETARGLSRPKVAT